MSGPFLSVVLATRCILKSLIQPPRLSWVLNGKFTPYEAVPNVRSWVPPLEACVLYIYWIHPPPPFFSLMKWFITLNVFFNWKLFISWTPHEAVPNVKCIPQLEAYVVHLLNLLQGHVCCRLREWPPCTRDIPMHAKQNTPVLLPCRFHGFSQETLGYFGSAAVPSTALNQYSPSPTTSFSMISFYYFFRPAVIVTRV